MSIYKITDIKDIRSRVILERLENNQYYEGAVIISCGNAYRSLKKMADKERILVIGLSTTQQYDGSVQLQNRFYSKSEISELYPEMFNATPGALSEELMNLIGCRLYLDLRSKGYADEKLMVPVGSGETILALSKFIPKDLLFGFTCHDYPPLRQDFTYLRSELSSFNIEEVKNLEDVFNFSHEYNQSIMVTW